MSSPALDDHCLEFRGRDRLVAALDAAVGAGDQHAVTAALRDALCRMIRDRQLELPACVFEPITDHYARREIYRSQAHGGDTMAALAALRLDKALAIGVETDILFPLQQQEQVADGLRAGGTDATFLPLESPQGHDAFLVDFARFDPAVRSFLAGL